MEAVSKRSNLISLALLAPAASVGVLAGMVFMPGTTAGKIIFTLSKAWLFLFPVVWMILVDRQRPGMSPVRKGGMMAGAICGVAIGLLICGSYLAFGSRLMDSALFAERMCEVGLGSWPIFLGGALYWILVNSVLEEYVWRWFVYTRCEALVRPATAVVLSSLLFTAHHFIAIRVYCSLPVTLLCSAGVFTGGVVWSTLYLRYRSIWPGYLSHAIVDLAVFAIGAAVLFG
jgi:uncharacterized protein